MIEYEFTPTGITAADLAGFFVGWPNPPSPETHLRLLHSSTEMCIARDRETGNIVGFITAISDGVLSAYIPFLEVLPSYQGRGVGKELVRKILERLKNLYMIDLLCDPDLQPFYESLGMNPATGMMVRRYENQSGHTSESD